MDDVLFRGKDGEGNAYVTRPVPGRRTEGIPSSVVRVRVCMSKMCNSSVRDVSCRVVDRERAVVKGTRDAPNPGGAHRNICLRYVFHITAAAQGVRPRSLCMCLQASFPSVSSSI